jgi:site-specific DNA-methyltransferase (adenine-specific)
MTNLLYYGDNLGVLRDSVRDESVDLIYLDPPFNSNAAYNVLYRSPEGQKSESQVEAFRDTWEWGDSAARAFEDVIRSRYTEAATLLQAMRRFLGESDLMAYLAMMAVRLIELHRVMKPTGSMYLHCDPAASHYLKLLLDSIFGGGRFRNEIVWKRTSGHADAKGYGSAHDVLLFYSASEDFLWNDQFQSYDAGYVEQYYRYTDENGRRFMSGDLSAAGLQGGGYDYEWRGVRRVWRVPPDTMERLASEGRIFMTKNGMPRIKRYLDEAKGLPAQDVWTDIEALRSWHKERLGYPTQKPLALLERIIAASSNPGDLVLDPFCGCGTAVHAAQKLGRAWIGIDITHLAIGLIERRLRDAFEPMPFEVRGRPKDIGGARDLAARDKHEFQLWALDLIDARSQGRAKKGPDRGIDGIRWFRTGPNERDFERVIVSVKGGENVGVAMIRDLKGTVEREGAKGGVFITLAEPTREMRREASASGFFDTGFGTHPRLQILTIAELLAGMRPDLPPLGRGEGFRRAPRERGPQAKQTDLGV